MKTIDVLIIGAGPAGLMAGAQIKNKSVILLDQSEKTSLKLLMSGAGQCNFTHEGDLKFFLEQYNGHKAFLKVAFKQFFNEDACAFFEKQGVATMVREDGKIFPKSMRAEDIKSALIHINERQGHQLHSGECVKDVQIVDGGFQIITSHGAYHATNLIGAFGGCSYPTTGSDGSLFQLFKGLGHTIMPLRPALSPVYTKPNALTGLQGLSFKDATVDCFRENQPVGSYNGDLLITHFGLSGPVVLDNSRFFRVGDQLRVQFGTVDRKSLEQYLIHLANTSGKLPIASAFKGLPYPKRLVEFLLDGSSIDKTKPISELSKKERHELLGFFCAYELLIDYVGGFNVAMATTGGVSVEELNRKTMASKIQEGLFFVGECVDIDGNTGGYNIQWALTSGAIAGREIDNLSQ
ncbi:MAG: aminoacetone oxidase family FAD-binding enzyme [Clostridia bacterium]|nr:aminoacetone oxidase family FAD-binding enzyme [Clostridia bacterium]